MQKIAKKKEQLKLLKSLSDSDFQFIKQFQKCNKQAKLFIKDLVKINPYFWDYGYELEIEYSYLKRLRETLLEEDLFVGCSRVCEQIQICLNLLDIIQNRKDCIKLITIEGLTDHTYKVMKQVNLKNAKRFVRDIEYFNSFSTKNKNARALAISQIYHCKAWHLYNKMREYFMQNWWS